MKSIKFKSGDNVWRYTDNAFNDKRYGIVREVFLRDVVVEFEDSPGIHSFQMMSKIHSTKDE